MSGIRGRLYWSQSHFERMQEMADGGWFKPLHTCMGRLDDGTEVEYTDMRSLEDQDPEGDYKFLGIGEWLGDCRTIRNETPLEKIEAQLMSSRYVPERLRTDGRFVEAFARFLRDGPGRSPVR